MLDRRDLLVGAGVLATHGILHNDADAQLQCTVNYRVRWPLNGTYSTSKISFGFGVNWVEADTCTGRPKTHVGIDIVDGTNTAPGATVKAAYGGVVAEVYTAQSKWGAAVVLLHGSCWTTVYWHVVPTVSKDQVVSQGQKIGTIFDLYTKSGGQYGNHLHFGFRAKPFNNPVSRAGALPKSACSGYPAAPEHFVNPTSLIWS
jgi:murein DD-endopeptidase MepM/ murein hydrolase activator NlpD